MTVSIVVVNWNAGAALDGCLESVAADGLAGRDVVLVDNDATDGSTARARVRHPWARVVAASAGSPAAVRDLSQPRLPSGSGGLAPTREPSW